MEQLLMPYKKDKTITTFREGNDIKAGNLTVMVWVFQRKRLSGKDQLEDNII